MPVKQLEWHIYIWPRDRAAESKNGGGVRVTRPPAGELNQKTKGGLTGLGSDLFVPPLSISDFILFPF